MNGQVKNQTMLKSVHAAKVHTGTKKERLSQKRLKALVSYDTVTGIFKRKRAYKNNRVGVGQQVGSVSGNGYLLVMINGKSYTQHRLAFLYMEGYFPEHGVDHINGVRTDNRWCNLRHATRFCNMQNKKPHKDSSSKMKGVSWITKTKVWKSQVCLNRTTIYLGFYESELDAGLARLTWEEQCDSWSCGSTDELIKRIKEIWPEFRQG